LRSDLSKTVNANSTSKEIAIALSNDGDDEDEDDEDEDMNGDENDAVEDVNNKEEANGSNKPMEQEPAQPANSNPTPKPVVRRAPRDPKFDEKLVIRLEGKATSQFMCPTKLAEEIDRCKPDAGIDSAFFNNHNKQIVIFALN
jgi:hypothetical protein